MDWYQARVRIFDYGEPIWGFPDECVVYICFPKLVRMCSNKHFLMMFPKGRTCSQLWQTVAQNVWQHVGSELLAAVDMRLQLCGIRTPCCPRKLSNISEGHVTLVSWLPYSSNLRIQAICCSETSVNTKIQAATDSEVFWSRVPPFS